jgi:hypothetical protein
MKKAKWALVTFLAIGSLSVLFFASVASDYHKTHSHQQRPSNVPVPVADGATNPSAVPDLIAYEILFNSVADEGSGGLEKSRAKLFGEKTKLSVDKIDLLRSTANYFKVSIKHFDAEAMGLKDAHWPRPAPAVLNQLAALQKQKEATLNAAVNSLLTLLIFDAGLILANGILESKKKVNVYPVFQLRRIRSNLEIELPIKEREPS